VVSFQKLYENIVKRTRAHLSADGCLHHFATDKDSPYDSYDLDGQVIVVSHDAQLAGAQRLLLSLLEVWQRRTPFPVKVICVGGGPLRSEFEQLFPTLVLSDFQSPRKQALALAQFIGQPARAIYASTVVNGPLLERLRSLGAPIITHCHELQASIERWAPGEIMAATLTNSDFVLGGCTAVAENLRVRHQVPSQRLDVVYDFIKPWNDTAIPTPDELNTIRRQLGITNADVVVFGCGTTDWRKGPDIFLDVAIIACQQDPLLKFVWIGGNISSRDEARIAESKLVGRIQFIGNQPLSRRYYYVGHIFALTSREDPCPLVALEAADAKLPVVCFERAGDIPHVLGPDCGAVVGFEDVHAFANAVLELSEDTNRRLRAGKMGYERVRREHTSEAAASEIEAIIEQVTQLPRKALGRGKSAPLVTVVIPNYNHQKFLPQRLDSVSRQSLRNLEILVLDDASTDDSRDILKAFVGTDLRARLICNKANSGSTFKQWRKGLAAAQGKYIWLAESDDAADYRLLEKLVKRLETDPSVVIAQSHSLMIDVNGAPLGRPNDWLNELAPQRWDSDYKNQGIGEIHTYLCQKNTIPNASAVVFRNFPGIEYLVDDTMRLCADWLFWIRLLARGNIAFVAQNLNYWRLNSSNARTSKPGVVEWDEGQKILNEACDILKLNHEERAQLLNRFSNRCAEWSHIGTQ
jgi:glycosyltransferase involved in cell wall biosynthesis